jgi:mRNA interferase MazF
VNEGDVVLAALPQADGHLKHRPAVALRCLPGFGDWLLCGVSTQLRQEIVGFDDPIRPGHVDSHKAAPARNAASAAGRNPKQQFLYTEHQATVEQ